MLLYLPQASGPLLLPLALDPLPVVASPSLPLTTTRQCSLEGTNQDVAVESVTVIFWILSQWYAQRDCDNSFLHSKCYQITHLVGGTELSQVLSNEGHLHCETECLPFTKLQLYVCVLIIHTNSLQ